MKRIILGTLIASTCFAYSGTATVKNCIAILKDGDFTYYTPLKNAKLVTHTRFTSINDLKIAPSKVLIKAYKKCNKIK